MEGDSNLVISRNLYAEKTRHRMSCIIRGLSAMQYDCHEHMDHLLRQLQEQSLASRSIGYECIVGLCQLMEDTFSRIDSRIEKPLLKAAISTLMEACQVILRHAGTTAIVPRRCLLVEHHS